LLAISLLESNQIKRIPEINHLAVRSSNSKETFKTNFASEKKKSPSHQKKTKELSIETTFRD